LPLPPPSRAAWASAAAIAVLGVAAAVAGCRAARRASFAAIVPPAVLASVGLVMLASGGERRDPFQRPQVERARAVLESIVPPGSLVITDTGLGRPAENITHYTGVRAIYASELELLGVRPTTAVMQQRLAGRRVFYLIDTRDRYSLAQLREATVRHRLVERREGLDLLEWFVSPREASMGAALYEVDLREEWKRGLDDLIAAGLAQPYPAYRGPTKRGSAAP
jgi:hypothetical protein